MSRVAGTPRTTSRPPRAPYAPGDARADRAPVPPESPAATSAVYVGTVAHRRFAPVEHAFHYPSAMLLLDLDELPQSLQAHRGWSVDRRAPVAFRRRDHHGDPIVPLAEAIRTTVAARTGHRPAGPIRLLTQPAVLGLCFNPVTFAYCFAPDGHTLEAVLAEVTNTPWGERHAYVVAVDRAEATTADGMLQWQLPKRFHVSPFMAMDHHYRWRLGVPAERLDVALESHRDGELVFAATLALRRRPLDHDGLRAYLRRQPLGTLTDVARIYGQAARLALKRVPRFAHPPRP